MPTSNASKKSGWRDVVFKNRGLLLVPTALILVIVGKPTTASAGAGIALAALGELVRIWAVGYSGMTTRSDVVTAPQLVTAGPYAYLRNPLYAGNAITALGFWLAFSGAVSPAIAALMLAALVVSVGFVYATIIPLEEEYLTRTFGAAYTEYASRVQRVIPLRGALPALQRRGTWRSSVIVRAESVTLGFFVLMTAAVLVKLRLV